MAEAVQKPTPITPEEQARVEVVRHTRDLRSCTSWFHRIARPSVVTSLVHVPDAETHVDLRPVAPSKA